MAFLLPNFSPTMLHQPGKQKEKPASHIPLSPLPQTPLPTTHFLSPISSPSPLQASPPVQLVEPTSSARDKHQTDNDFYLNLGVAVRTLREDLPLVFSKDLNYDIYRDDITFVEPLNTFTGIENYKLIFRALRFHSRILFREIKLEVYRIWQPSEKSILIRWNLRAVPRVPWEAKGEFQGASRYKLDRNGKIYEHKVDNLAFNFPQPFKPATSVLDLLAAAGPASPNPTFFWGLSSDACSSSSSWVKFYQAVKGTLDQERCFLVQDGMVTYS